MDSGHYVLVCDAAAPNVSVIKATTGVHGAYGNGEVKPEFRNPFDPMRMVYWIICPSHQVSHLTKLYLELHGAFFSMHNFFIAAAQSRICLGEGESM